MFAELVTAARRLSPTERRQRMREVEARRRADEAELAALVLAAKEAGDFREDGHRTIRGMLRAELRWSESEVRARTQTARVGATHPEVLDQLSAGRIGVAQAHLLAKMGTHPRVGNQLGQHLAVLVDHAVEFEYADFDRLVQHWRRIADADGAHRDVAADHANRHLTVVAHDGSGHLHGSGGALDTAELIEILGRYQDAEFRTDWDHCLAEHGDGATVALLPRTDAQRRWDALMAMARDAAATPADARRPQPVVTLAVDVHTFQSELARLGLTATPERPVPPIHRLRCETTNGVPLAPIESVLAAIDGRIRTAVFNADGNVVDYGRRKRLFDGVIAELLKLIAPRCVWPGCHRPAGTCEIDHVDEWHHGGRTDPANASLLCGYHNRLKHHGYRVWRDPERRWHTYRPDGTEVAPPINGPPTRPPPSQQAA